MRNILILIVFFPLLNYAQLHDEGIKFLNGFTWEQIKQKAREENKYIFVDCYATWCGPCKKMDKEVYPDEEVGSFFNEYFICVKIQMDTTKQDNENIKAWYPVGEEFKKEYVVSKFPTYLFFDPNGKIVNKHFGYRNREEILKIGKNSLNPSKQYYTLLQNYKNGVKKYSELADLANKAKAFGDTAIAKVIARDYLINCLSKKTEQELLNKDDIEFIANNVKIDDKLFNLFVKRRAAVDNVMGHKRYSLNVFDAHLYAELIFPFFVDSDKRKRQPDWKDINRVVTRKFSRNDAIRNVFAAKFRWWGYKQNYLEYARAVSEWSKEDLEAIEADYSDINQHAWNIFIFVDDKKYLSVALKLSDKAIQYSLKEEKSINPNYIDTKANLLYKLGHISEAIRLEEEALQIATKQKEDFFVNEFAKNLQLMKSGKPTWKLE